jgi:hypothetical protein
MVQSSANTEAEANQAAYRRCVGNLSLLHQRTDRGNAAYVGEQPRSEALIAKMASEVKKDKPRFSAKTISNYVQVVKMVVASASTIKGRRSIQ